MTELQKAVALVEYARDTAEILHSTFVRIKLDEALACLYKVQVDQEDEMDFWKDELDMKGYLKDDLDMKQ